MAQPLPANECAGLRVLAEGKELREHEDTFIRKDGSFFPVVYSASPLESEGRTIGLVVAFRDDTLHRRAQQGLREIMAKERQARAQAESANRVKDEFLAMVSHELRTPLNAIVGWTKLLKRGGLSAADSERAIQSIDRNVSAQATIINELLDVSAIISGKLQLRPEPVRLSNVINAALDIARPIAQSKSIKLESSLDPTVGPVTGEFVRLQQVVWNLLDNALKFTPKGGRIESGWTARATAL